MKHMHLFLVATMALAISSPAVLADVYSDLGAIHNFGLAPTGISGTALGGNEASGFMDTPFSAPAYDYSLAGGVNSNLPFGDNADFKWLHETSAFDTPSLGTKWSFSSSSNQYLLLPSIDHPPIPQEALEGTLWGSADGGATWIKGTLVEVYDGGWHAGSVDDDFASRWTFSSSVNMISLTQGLRQNSYFFMDNDVEVDSVQQVIPVPGAALLGAMGLGLVGSQRKRTS